MNGGIQQKRSGVLNIGNVFGQDAESCAYYFGDSRLQWSKLYPPRRCKVRGLGYRGGKLLESQIAFRLGGQKVDLQRVIEPPGNAW